MVLEAALELRKTLKFSNRSQMLIYYRPMKIEEDEDRVSYVSSDEDCDDERDSDYYPQRSPRPSVDGRKRNRYGQFC